MAKGLYAVFRTKEELERHDEEVRHIARVAMLDKVTAALGRMGFLEPEFRTFDQNLTEVDKEFKLDFVSDFKADKTLVYSLYALDRELKQYVGNMFVPAEERYK